MRGPLKCAFVALLALCLTPSLFGNGNNHAVLICGITPSDWLLNQRPEPEYRSFWNDLFLCDELVLDERRHYGGCMQLGELPADHIHVLFGEGSDWQNPVGRYQHEWLYSLVPITDNWGHKDTILEYIRALANGSSHGITPMGAGDTLFIYTFGHGGTAERIHTNYSLCVRPLVEDTGRGLVPTDLWDTTFGRAVGEICAAHKIVLMEQCHSGGFIDNLADDNTVMVTACEEDERSWPADDQTVLGAPALENDTPSGQDVQYHGEFGFHYMNALRWHNVFSPTGGYEAPDTVNADYDPDGTVSWYEAFLYADGNDSRKHSTPEHPVYFDRNMVWQPRAVVPVGGGRRVKAGGSLAAFQPRDTAVKVESLYAFKGNNTREFFVYHLSSNMWATLESIRSTKTVYEGGHLCAGASRVYATVGHNTSDFWEYDPTRTAGNRWVQKPSVPGGKLVKQGGGLALVCLPGSDAEMVFLLKGSGTREFYRFTPGTDAWVALDSVPLGAKRKKCGLGSCLTYDGNDTLYAFKGTNTNEFYAYSISGGHWVSKETIPQVAYSGGRPKKPRSGAALAYCSANSRVYAFKGRQTGEFWAYDPATGHWGVADSVPKHSGAMGPDRYVEKGGALAYARGFLWGLKGNNTYDFLRFTPNRTLREPGMAGAAIPPGANEVSVATGAGSLSTDPHWSPQGNFIYYCRPDGNGRNQVFRTPANAVSELQLSYLSGDCSRPTPSPDGQTVAFCYMPDEGPWSRIAAVPSGGGQVTELTSASADCGEDGLCWSAFGAGIYYGRDSAGDCQLAFVSATGGAEQILTSSAMRHTCPYVLSSTELVFQGEDAQDGSSQIFRLNLQTSQEVQLTSGDDHENLCCAAGARLVGSEVTGDGYTGIAVFSADGGTESVITSGDFDWSSPAVCCDGSVLSAVREGSSGGAVCLFDLVEGTSHVLTDALADREAPDVQVVNSAQHLVSTAYSRDGDVYKVDYLSSSGLVIAPNGFRAGIARDPNGYVHSVYSDGTLIRHEVQDQSGTCIRQDTPGYGDSPSLSMSIAGDAVVVSRRGDSIFGSIQRPNNSWRRVLLYTAPASHHVGPPASAAFQVASGRFINACVPCYHSPGPSSSMILFMQADTLGNVVLDTLDLFTGSYADSSVCMAVNSATSAVEAAYQRSESIFYRAVHLSPTDSMRPIPWTGPSKVNDSATTGRHPVCERRNGRFYAAFSESWIDSASSNRVWSIVRASCCDTVPTVTWEGRGPVSSVDIARKDYASLSRTHTAWAESSSTLNRWLIKANIADSQVTLSPDTSCVSCALLCDSTVLARPATALTRLRLVWLQKYGSSGDTWTVPGIEREIYDASADANVTRYNQGRKLCLDSTGSSTDSIRVVFRSDAASLRVASKRDGDETWTSSLLRNTGDMPAIDQSQGRIWVCDRDVSTVPPGNVIRCQNRAIGSSTWHDFQVYFTANPNPANSRLGPPAIVASLNDTSGQNRGAAYVIFTAYTPSPPKSAVVICKVDTGGVIWTDTLHSVSSLTDSFADVAAHSVAGQGYGLHATWGQAGTIQYRKTTNLDQPEFTLKRVWSPSYSVGTGTTLRHSVVAASAETVLVAYVAGDSGRIMTRGQAPGSDYNVWDDTVNVSQCPDTVADWPSIAPLVPAESVIITYQKRLSGTNFDVMARVNFHASVNLSNSSANSKYPHCASHLHNDSFPVITAIWTEELGNSAEVGYKRWQLGMDGGGGIQDFSIFNPNIHPALFAPSPNPFNHSSSIRFATNIKGLTRVSIIDITGRRVRNLLCAVEKPGIYNLTWNAKDDRERKLAGGVYFVRLLTPNYHETRKVVLTQ